MERRIPFEFESLESLISLKTFGEDGRKIEQATSIKHIPHKVDNWMKCLIFVSPNSLLYNINSTHTKSDGMSYEKIARDFYG